MDFVKIGNKSNPPDRNGKGCVPYEYEIARCAISNADWCEFLNAVESNRLENQRHLAEGRIDAWLMDVTPEKFGQSLCSLVEENSATKAYRFKTSDERERAIAGAKFFFKEFSRKIIVLSDGRCVYFAPDARARERNGGNLSRCWAEYAFHAVSSTGSFVPGGGYRERWFNQDKADAIPLLEAIIKAEVCGAMLSDKQREKDAVLFLGNAGDGRRIEIVSHVDYVNEGVHNLTEVTVLLKNSRKKSPPLKPLSEVVDAVERHQGAGYLPPAVHSLPYCGSACKGVLSLGLYHKDMTTGVLGGIVRSRTSGETPLPRYVPKKGWEKKPVTYVTYTGVMRYCNWLMTGDMEKGAYDLTVTPPRRLEGAKYFLPTDDEWYKAAYYDCSIVRLFGLFDWLRGKGGYWKYPTRSNEIPSQSQANYERGDCLSPLALTACPQESNNRTIEQSNNYFYLADVDAYADSASPCGALQMGGNAWEFLEDCFQNPLGNKLRGGSFGYTETGLSSANVDFGKYDKRCYVFGARICQMKDGWRPRRKPLRYVIILKIKTLLRKLLAVI